MEQSGLIIGGLLLAVVSVCAWALGAKANAGVHRFREDHHQTFQGRDPE